MEIKTEHASPLCLKKFRISECYFRCSEGDLDNVKGKFRISHKIENAGADNYKITLDFFLESDARSIELSAKCVSYFETKLENTSVIERNAIAIMFPYIRNYVSNITLQSDMKPIVLPLINPLAMTQDS